MSASNAHQTRALGLLVVVLGLVILVPKLRPEKGPERASCPQEFPQTLMAATLLWDRADVGYAAPEPLPVDAHHPQDLRLLTTEADAETCARIHAAIPDSLKPLGLLAPWFAAYYQLGDLYVVPVQPSISPAEIEAEMRGEAMIDKVGVTFVFDESMNVLAAVEN